MAEHKSQHFVPRFYLENFSFDGGTRFHLFHVGRQELRANVGVREQCAANYFYGKDLKIEKTFRELEGAVSTAIRDIIAARQMPAAGSDGDLVFRTHVALQWGRTCAHISEQHEMIGRTVKTAFVDNQGGKTPFEQEIEATSLEDSMRMSVATSADSAAFLGDLESKLIDANGHGEFVTSDTPVVMANPYYLGRYPGGVTGLGVSGLVMWVPISPRYLAVYYDRDYYRVGSPHQRTIALESASDLAALNNFQCLNAASTVYFQNESFGPKLIAAYRSVARLRLTERHGVRCAVATGPNGPKEIVHSYRVDINYRPQMGFFSVRRKHRGEREDVDQIPLRDARLHDMFHDYLREVFAHRRDRGFLLYLAEQASGRTSHEGPPVPSGGRTAIRVLESLVRHGSRD